MPGGQRRAREDKSSSHRAFSPLPLVPASSDSPPLPRSPPLPPPPTPTPTPEGVVVAAVGTAAALVARSRLHCATYFAARGPPHSARQSRSSCRLHKIAFGIAAWASDAAVLCSVSRHP